MRQATVVLGLGNPLMSDEGVGLEVVRRLSDREADYPLVDFVDAGTGGLSVLHLIQGRRKAVFVDCALMGEDPGAIRRFTPDEVRSVKVLAQQSLHEADLLRIIDMARQLGQVPQEVVLFGIQPERVEPHQGLSETLEARLEQYVGLVCAELTR
jgi:hydrogenase maturation protease